MLRLKFISNVFKKTVEHKCSTFVGLGTQRYATVIAVLSCQTEIP